MDSKMATFYGSLRDGERKALQAADARLDTALGKDTESTFQKGEALISARDLVPDQTFSRWCSLRWPGHRTYAYAHMRVAEHLGSYRKRLVEAGVHPSTLLTLASHPDRVEALLDLYLGNARPTHRQAKAMILGQQNRSATEAVRPADIGGLAGLRLLHAAKKNHLPEVRNRIERIIAAIEDALAAPRLLKGKLAETITMEARWAQVELYNLCAFIEPAPWDSRKPTPVRFSKESGWARVIEMLFDLGGEESWPSQRDLQSWLTDKALPILIWAARGEGDVGLVAEAQAALTEAETVEPSTAEAGSSDAAESAAADRREDVAGASVTAPTRVPGPEIAPEPAAIESTASFLVFLRSYCRDRGSPMWKTEAILKETATVLGETLKDALVVDGWPSDRIEPHSLAAAAYLASLHDPSNPMAARRLPTSPV